MSRQAYLKDRQWADKWSPEVRLALERLGGKLIFQQASNDTKDKRHATDWELQMEHGDIAVRFRRQTSYRDLTIRSKRVLANGQEIKTEHQKILENEGLIAYLYCWTDDMGTVTETMLVDLRVLRSSGLMQRYKQLEKINKDKETYFYAIPQKDLRLVGALIETVKAPEKTPEDMINELRQQHGATIAEYRRYLEGCGVAVDP